MLGKLARAASSFAGPATCTELAGQPSFVNITGRTERPVIQSSSTKVLLIYGQSNAISIVNDTSFVPTAGTENYNVFNGKNYAAKDPLLGLPQGDGITAGSSWTTRLGSKMIDAGMAARMVIVNIAVGGTLVANWDIGGVLDGRLAYTIRSMIQAGTKPDYILQMQGESDALAATPAANYTASVNSVVSTIRRNGSSAPIFISNTSLFTGATSDARTAVRLGQSNSWNAPMGVFAGPDTDTVTSRQPDGHLNLAALDPMANLWLATIQSH